jgi:hypothetical protein
MAGLRTPGSLQNNLYRNKVWNAYPLKLAIAETGMGAETVRAPRLTIEGDERARILGIVREAIRTRPAESVFRRER